MLAVGVLILLIIIAIIYGLVEDSRFSNEVKAEKKEKIDEKTLNEMKAQAKARIAGIISQGKWPGIRKVSQKVPIQEFVRLGFSFKSNKASLWTSSYVPEDKILRHIRKHSFPELLPLWAVYLHLAQFYETRKLLKAARKVIKEMEFKEKHQIRSGAVSQHIDEEELRKIERFLKVLQG